MVKLLHLSLREGDNAIFFYDGELESHDGVLEVPDNRPEWVRAAWVKGYRLDPKTEEFLTYDKIEAQLADSAESAGEKDGENTRSRGRTVPKDGIRKG